MYNLEEECLEELGYHRKKCVSLGYLTLDGTSYHLLTDVEISGDVGFCKVLHKIDGTYYEGGVEFSKYSPWYIERGMKMEEKEYWSLQPD